MFFAITRSLTGGTVTLPTLKQYSTTEKQHTTPPSSLGCLTRTDATFFAASSELSASSASIPGVVAPVRVPMLLSLPLPLPPPEDVSGVVVPDTEGEGSAERVIPNGGGGDGSVAAREAAREALTCSTAAVGLETAVLLLPLLLPLLLVLVLELFLG
jgi:hypothetical protein